jgi:membrane-bound ClpP family serine protease
MSNLTLAYLLIALGLGLLLAELFIPSGGVLFVIAAGCLIAGVALTFYYGDTTTGLVTLLVVFLAIPLIAIGGLYIWPYTPFGKKLIREGPSADDTVAALPGLAELEVLKGRLGKALSPLRPSGVAEFDGKRVDVITEGFMVEPGQWVRCVEVKGSRVVVRPVDPPDLSTFEQADFS